MKFFEDRLWQEINSSYTVCGDTCLCERRSKGTTYIVCDGVGSGIYANIAAITCASRIMELLQRDISARNACEMVAASMHRARKEDIPFAAFSVAVVMPDGQFLVYNYEAPSAILFQNGFAGVLKPDFVTAGYEVMGEATGTLQEGDALMLFSDGVTQSGLGHGYGMGIGSEGIASYINKIYEAGDDIRNYGESIIKMCSELSKGRYEDDTTVAMIYCRPAKELTLLTGPPSKPSMDREYVKVFMDSPGKKIICGSTTIDIVSRELGKKARVLKMGSALGNLPEYALEGIDITTEGAIMLNQVLNILDQPREFLTGDSVVERFCALLQDTDVINLMIGSAVNDAHETMLFKQIGVRVRRTVIELIAKKLRDMGKLVTEKHY